MIRHGIINWKTIQKPSRGNKRGIEQESLETPMNLEDFYYGIPKIPSAEDLLKKIIKRLNMTNEKINFLSFHFVQDLRELPSGMFTNIDEDNKK